MHSELPVREVRQLYNRTLPICPLLSHTEQQVGLLGRGLSGTCGTQMPVDTPPFMDLKSLAEPLSDLTMSKSFNDVVFVCAL